MPKCLVPINGQPLLGIWLRRLAEAHCGPFLINTHFMREAVESFISSCPQHAQVTLAYEPVLLGTAGTLLSSLDFFADGDGMLIHADNYCRADISEFIQAHRRRPPGCLMTMMTFRCEDPSSCGIVTVNADGVMIGFDEKPLIASGNLANGAVYILSAEFIEHLRGGPGEVADFSTEVLPSFLGRIYTYETSATLIDIGTPRAYGKANSL